MSDTTQALIIGFLVGFIVGGIIVYLLARGSIKEIQRGIRYRLESHKILLLAWSRGYARAGNYTLAELLRQQAQQIADEAKKASTL